MASNHHYDQELERLRARNEFLEEAHRWHLFALDLLLSMRDAHDDSRHGRNPAAIIAGAREYLHRLLKWKSLAFLTVSEENAGFELFDCQPLEEWEWMQREADKLIESGEFAWALNQNREVIYPAHERNASLVLHVLTTRSRIRGMFVGVPAIPVEEIPEGALHLLSILLHHTAYVLESAELYRLLSEENRALEENLAERTAELQYRHTHDELTGLPNRVLLVDRLGQAIKHAERGRDKVAILILDLDAFKLINDSLGRDSGNELIRQLAHRLRQHLRSYDTISRINWEDATIARLGGDEFCVLLPGVETIDDVANVVRRLKDMVSEPFDIHAQLIYGSCCIGVSVFPEDGDDAETLITRADAALHHAKNSGKNTHQFYAPRLNAQALTHLTLTAELRHALANDEFVLHYQPQIESASGRVVSVEALIRWQRRDGRLVPPGEFIPVLEEEAALIIPTGEWVLREAGRALKRLREAGFPQLRMAVNVSAVQFADVALMERIRGILDAERIPPEGIELELTESTLMRDVPHANDLLEGLNALGMRLAVDDFGTGYSSLAYLRRFPIDTLKVDRSFIQEVPGDAEDAAIVRAIIALAHSLSLEVVAEGVETAEQLQFLSTLNCQHIQGFHFSRPLPEEQLLEFLRTHATAN